MQVDNKPVIPLYQQASLATLSYKNIESRYIIQTRLMTMSSLYPCGKPCSTTETHNETVKELALFFAIINGIMMELRLRIPIPWEWFSILQLNRKCYHIYTYRNNSNLQISQSDWYSRNRRVCAKIGPSFPKQYY